MCFLKYLIAISFLSSASGFALPSQAASLVNGNFETGNLHGWQTFTTDLGTVGDNFPTVQSFDTNDDGVASNAAAFNVGQIEPEEFNPQNRGGGIFQTVALGDGQLDISVDIASDYTFSSLSNASGGFFELLLENSVVATHDFGFIRAGTTEFSQLSSSFNITADFYDIGLRITRPFGSSELTPIQYVDNFQISGSATQSKAIPEPLTILGTLTTLGVGGIFKRKYGQKPESKQF